MYINMHTIIEQAHLLLQNPHKLNQITQELLQGVSKHHHPHNKLLPGSFVAELLAKITPQNIIDNNQGAAQFLLSLNTIRAIIVSNFGEFSHNKLYTALIMNHAACLQELSRKVREDQEEGTGIWLRLVARGWMAQQAVIKLLQKSHTFVPEYYRFVHSALEAVFPVLSKPEQSFDEEEFKKMSKIGQGSTTPVMLFRAPFKKQWKRQLILLLVSQLGRQVVRSVQETGHSRQTGEIQLVKDICSLYEKIRSVLSEKEQQYYTELSFTLPEKSQETMYIDEPIQVRELTPRFYDQEEEMKIKKLKRKREKIKKKMEVELRQSVQVKQQERQAIEEVRREKGDRQRRKEMLIVEKQTVEAKKMQKAMKKAKKIQKTKK